MRLISLLCLLLSVSASAGPAGQVPIGMPSKLSIGLFEGDNDTWMSQSGVGWDIRYRYLAGFDQSTTNWANDYNASSPRNGSFATAHMVQTAGQGYIPAFSLYEYYGLPTGWEGQSLLKAQSISTNLQFFQDVKLLFQRIKDFNKPVLLLMEPDLDAFLQQYSNDNPNTTAAVASTGMPELQGLPNTLAGFHLAILALKKSTGATNAIVGLHVSGWATGVDLFHTPEGLATSLSSAVDTTYAFLAPCGLAPNVTGLTYDVLVGDPLDRDYDYYRLTRSDPNRKWDMSDSAAVNSASFNRYAEWLRLWNVKAGKRWVLWQIPVGNALSRNVCQNGTQGSGYIDNRPEYFFGSSGDAHRRKFVDVGVISMLFGAGDDCGTTQETDNNYLRNGVQAFLASGGLPFTAVDSGTPIVDSGVPLPLDAGTCVCVCPTLDSGVQVVDAGTPVVDSGITVVDAGRLDSGIPDSGVKIPDAGSVIVDAGIPPSGDPAQYNFETTAQGFTVPSGVVAVSTVQKWAGQKSLGIQFTVTAASSKMLTAPNPSIPRGATITYHIYLPVTTMLTSLQVFAQEDSATAWKWNSNWFPKSALVVGWNTFTLTLPTAPGKLQSVGVEFQFNAPYAGLLFVDSIGWGGAVTTPDPSTPPAAVPDAGVVTKDAGTAAPDAGTVDAGAPVVGGTIRVMPLGDSITAASHGWRCATYTTLRNRGYNIVFVGSQTDIYDPCASKHEGHPGLTISDIDDSLDGWLSASQPNMVILMAGTNDLAWWTTETGTEIANRQNGLITRIQQRLPGADIVVQTVPPQSPKIIEPNNVDRALLTQQYNTQLRVLISNRVALGQRVRLADVNAVLLLSDLYDGIHPSEAAGINKMTPVIVNAAIPLLN